MFRRILVPVDDTRRAVEALDVAQKLAQRHHAEVVLLRVAEPIADLDEVTWAHQELDSHVRALREHGIAARYFVEFGSVDETIAQTAVFQHIDLVILAPHQRDWLEAIQHVSLAPQLVRHLGIPLLVWPGTGPGKAFSNLLGRPESRVIVPLDGSDLAERALPLAMALAGEYAKPLTLARVVPHVAIIGAGPEARRLGMRLEAQEHDEATRYLGSLRQRLTKAMGDHMDTVLLHGTPAGAISRLADERQGSVVVMSTHGRTGLGRLFVGSVAISLIRAANIPLFVIPPHAVPADGSQPTAQAGIPARSE